MKKNDLKLCHTLDQNDSKKIAMKVSVVSIIINLLLSLFKFLAGIIGHSGAMISDAVHSASDVFSTFIVIIGVNISSKKSDEEHQYGHDRLECVAAIILAVILSLTGLGIGYSGIEKIFFENSDALVVPSTIALIAAIVSIAIKEWMYWYTRNASKKINSPALMADAWHHRSDALSSVGAFIGILGAEIGFPILDPIASVVICLFIEKASYKIFKDSIDKMIDKSCSNELIAEMKEVILKQQGVEHIDDIKTRLFGSKIYVDVEFSADGDKSLIESHEIAENVHKAIEDNFPNVKHCMVHVNPVQEVIHS
ncbi:MAG: cation diffusion facilitator family transporter [Clostridiaceae bacterium]|nr:cation diffusion facilitator family transporter [Clostridiaceae bacterium]